MADFKPDHELESKEFNETFKTTKTTIDLRATYSAWPVWLKSLIQILAAAVIIVILVLIGRSIHHHTEHHSKTGGAGVSTANKKAASNPSIATSGNSVSGTASNASKPGQLANTGPGDLAAVFAVSAIAGTSAHYVISRRRV